MTTTTRITHADIELASLNRLENITASLMHMLREEKQRSIATLIVTLLPKEEESGSNEKFCDKERLEHCGNFLISNIRVHSTPYDELPSPLHMAKETSTKKGAMESQSRETSSRSDNDDDAASIVDIKTLEADMLSLIHSMRYNHAWLHERAKKYSWYKQRRQKRKHQQDSTHRSSSSSSSSSLAETESSSFDSAMNRLHILPIFHDNVNISNASAPSELKLGMFLFFQWICLLSSIHEECPIELLHFKWLPLDGIVRVYTNEPPSEPPIDNTLCKSLLRVLSSLPSSSPPHVSHLSVDDDDDNDHAVSQLRRF